MASRASTRKLLLAVGILSAVVLGCAGLCGLSFFALGTSEMPMRPEDRALLLTAEEVGPWLELNPEATSSEELRVSRIGHAELTYEYSDDDLTITSELGIELREASAISAVKGYQLGIAIATARESDPEWGPCQSSLVGADEVHCRVAYVDGQRLGLVLFARLGARTYLLALGGADFDTPEFFAEALQPKLDQFKRWKPPAP